MSPDEVIAGNPLDDPAVQLSGRSLIAIADLCTQCVITWRQRMSDADRDRELTIRRLGVREFRGNMVGFLRQVRQSSSFLITSRDEVLAEIRPPSKPVRPHRQPGALRGKIQMADDFDALQPETLAAMEGEEG